MGVFIMSILAFIGHIPPSLGLHTYIFIEVYVFRPVYDVLSIFDPLGPCCRSRGDRIWQRAPILCVLTPLFGHGGRLRRMWGLHVSLGRGGGGRLGSSGPLLNDFRAVLQRSEKGGEAGSDPMTWFHCH